MKSLRLQTMRNAIIITLLVSTLLTFTMTMSNSNVTASRKMLRFAEPAQTDSDYQVGPEKAQPARGQRGDKPQPGDMPARGPRPAPESTELARPARGQRGDKPEGDRHEGGRPEGGRPAQDQEEGETES